MLFFGRSARLVSMLSAVGPGMWLFYDGGVGACREAQAVARNLIRIPSQALDAHPESQSPLTFLSKCPFRNFLNRPNHLGFEGGGAIRPGAADVDA
jgi:hypothetical protein